MTALLALLLALAPQPKTDTNDDFNEVVRMNEIGGCEAIRLFRTTDDQVRVVIYRCPKEDRLIPFIRRGDEGWFGMGVWAESEGQAVAPATKI